MTHSIAIYWSETGLKDKSQEKSPCKKTQFSLRRVTSFLQAPKPGTTPVARKSCPEPTTPPRASPSRCGGTTTLREGRGGWDGPETAHRGRREAGGKPTSGLGRPRHRSLSTAPPQANEQ